MLRTLAWIAGIAVFIGCGEAAAPPGGGGAAAGAGAVREVRVVLPEGRAVGIERTLAAAPEVEHVWSVSDGRRAIVSCRVRAPAREALAVARDCIPEELPGVEIEDVSGRPVAIYAAVAQGEDDLEASRLLDRLVDPSVVRVSGVGRVERIGRIERRVLVTPRDRESAARLTAALAGDAALPPRFASLDDLLSFVLDEDGTRVRDVARAEIIPAPRPSLARVEGRTTPAGIVWSNGVDDEACRRAVAAKLGEIAGGLPPDGPRLVVLPIGETVQLAAPAGTSVEAALHAAAEAAPAAETAIAAGPEDPFRMPIRIFGRTGGAPEIRPAAGLTRIDSAAPTVWAVGDDEAALEAALLSLLPRVEGRLPGRAAAEGAADRIGAAQVVGEERDLPIEMAALESARPAVLRWRYGGRNALPMLVEGPGAERLSATIAETAPGLPPGVDLVVESD